MLLKSQKSNLNSQNYSSKLKTIKLLTFNLSRFAGSRHGYARSRVVTTKRRWF